MSHVLVVEDNPMTAETLASMVSLLGHDTQVVLSPRKAIESIQRSIPNLILLDLNMPGVNGLEVCRYIKRDPMVRETPVIIITAEDDPTVIEAAKEAGASGYLVKPVELDKLEMMLSRELS
jgi:two-component system chemotaxis response regulator CheY